MKEYKLEIALSILCLALIGVLIWAAATSPPNPEAHRCRGAWNYVVGYKGRLSVVWNSCAYMIPREEK